MSNARAEARDEVRADPTDDLQPSAAPVVRTRRRRSGTKVELTETQIVDVARGLLAEHGVDGLTIQRLSTALGVSAGAMYYHVDDKDAVLRKVAQRIFEEITLPGPQEGDWVERWRALMQHFYVELRRYPGFAAYIMTHVFDDASHKELGSAVRDLLVDAGFSSDNAENANTVMFFYAAGALLCEPILARGWLTDEEQLRLYTDGVDRVLAGIQAHSAPDEPPKRA